jgi:hypothetical protein
MVRSYGVPAPVRELRAIPGRRFRFDLAWPDVMLAVEVQGGVWTRGRHTRGAGYTADCEKLCLSVVHGWRMLWVTTAQIKSGQAAQWIVRAGWPHLRATRRPRSGAR